jgi:hypothetical protein
MDIFDLMNHPIISKLPGSEFKAFVLLKSQAVDGHIDGFTIRGTQREWLEKEEEYNLPTSKTKVKDIIRNLIAAKCIRYKNRKLKILI